MFQKTKDLLYFHIAYYFRFFAQIKLSRWKPKVIVITGSSGKTTLLHLVEAQIGSKARYSHHANSAYGIPFDILGLHRKELKKSEWFGLFLKAPILAFSKIPEQKIYIVEADADRPFEANFVSNLLKPNVTIWVSSAITHSANFEKEVASGKFKSSDEAIAFEFGYFIERTRDLAILNLDNETIESQVKRTKAKILQIRQEEYLSDYIVSEKGTQFKIKSKTFHFPYIFPKIGYFSIAATEELLSFLGLPFDRNFSDFKIPPGRGTILEGINNSVIIDSSYNASKRAVLSFLDLADELKKDTKRKITFLFADMRELGEDARDEHIEVARRIDEVVDYLYCVGPITEKFVIPNFSKTKKWFSNSKAAGVFLMQNLEEKSLLLVKGSQNELFLEEAIKYLLKDPKDESKLCRQEDYWMRIKEKFFAKHF